ncbi:MAG: DUF6882 domain-containing protein [Myxococcales bacterium]
MGSLRGDVKFMRLASLMEGDVQRMLASQTAHVAGHDEAKLDGPRGVVVYAAKGSILWEARIEVIGSLTPDLGMWRWWWSGRIGQRPKASMDLAFAEGQRHGIVSLTSEGVAVANEEEAKLLAHIAAVLAHADGMLRSRSNGGINYLALFEVPQSEREKRSSPPAYGSRTASSAPGRGSMVPSELQEPPSSRFSIPSAAAAPLRERQFEPETFERPSSITIERPSSIPLDPGLDDPFAAAAPAAPTQGPSVVDLPALDPGDELFSIADEIVASKTPFPPPLALAAAADVREPARELVAPVAQLALSTLTTALQGGFQQGLLVLQIEYGDAAPRLAVTLVASDGAGMLAAVDVPKALVVKATEMIARDMRSGNGRWRRLTVRLGRGTRGILVDVKVRA